VLNFIASAELPCFLQGGDEARDFFKAGDLRIVIRLNLFQALHQSSTRQLKASISNRSDLHELKAHVVHASLPDAYQNLRDLWLKCDERSI
jgi:hypothetical protein